MKYKLILILLLVSTVGFGQVIVPIGRLSSDTTIIKKTLPNQFRDYVEWCKNRDTTRIIVYRNRKLRM